MPKPIPIATWNPSRDLWETMDAPIFGPSEGFSETWPTAGMTRNGVAYELPTWAPPMDASGSSSLPSAALLPTPTTSEGTGAGNGPAKTGGDNLRTAVTLLPTPVAQPSGNTPQNHLRKKPGREVVTDLAIIVENDLLPTGGRMRPPSSGGSNFTDEPLPMDVEV